MPRKSSYKPGQKVPTSGQYSRDGSRLEVTVSKGERFPPSQRPGQRYTLRDATKHAKK